MALDFLRIQVTGLEPEQYLKVLFCGPQGSGKTLTASTFSNPFFASCEGGMLSLRQKRIPYYDITDTKTLEELKGYMGQPSEVREKVFGRPVDTFVVDTIDEVQKLYIQERLASTHKEAMSMQDWGWLAGIMRSLISGLRNLEMNVVLTCHLKDSRDEETGHIFVKPALQGAMGDEIAQYFDLAVRLRATPGSEVVGGVVERKINRFIQTYPDLNHEWIKDRSGSLPAEFPINFVDDYERMTSSIIGDAAKARAAVAAELDQERENAIERAAAMAQDLVADAKEDEAAIPDHVLDDDQLRVITELYAQIGDDEVRTTSKTSFVKIFGSPSKIAADRFEEVKTWIEGEVKRLVPEEKAETPAEIPAPQDAPPEPQAPVSEPETATSTPPEESPAKVEPSGDKGPWNCNWQGEGSPCSILIEDQEHKEFSELRYGDIFCREHFRLTGQLAREAQAKEEAKA